MSSSPDRTNLTPSERKLIDKTQLLNTSPMEIAPQDFYALFMQTPVGICIVRGEELVYELANPLYCTLAGRDDLVGKPLLEALPELKGQGFDDLLHNVMRTGLPFIGQENLLKLNRDGEMVDTYWTFIYAPLRNNQGIADRVIAICNEITEQVIARKKAEEEKQRADAQRALLEAVLQQTPVGVIIAEVPSGKIILGNKQVEDIWQQPFISATDIGEYRMYQGFHADGSVYQPEEWPLARSVKNGEVIVDEVIDFLRGDGSIGTMNVSSAPVRNSQGETIAAVVTFFDVTEHKQAERALKDSEAQLAAIVNQAAVGIAETDITGKFTLVNDQYCNMVGYSRQELLEKRMRDITHPDDLLKDSGHFERMVKTGEPFTIEKRYLRKDGSYLWVNNNVALVQNYSRGQRTPLAVSLDITERKKADAERAGLLAREQVARQEAEQAVLQIRLLQEVTSSLAHVKSLSEIASVVFKRVTPRLDAHLGAIFLLSSDGTMLHLVEQSGMPSQVAEYYRQFSLAIKAPVTDAIHAQSPVWIQSESDYEQQYPHLIESIHATIRAQAVVCLPLRMNQKIGGAITFSFPRTHIFDQKEQALLVAIADQCAQAIEQIRLYERERELAVMEERQRLARDLHDAVSQTLFSSTTIAEALPRLWERNPQKTLQRLEQVVTLNQSAMAEMRTLLLELRPETILKTDMNLLLNQLVTAAKGRTTIGADLKVEVKDLALPPDVHVAFYRIAQESINNILKHSRASHFTVYLNETALQVKLVINDNGQGFDTTHSFAGLGLRSLRERAKEITAAIQIESAPHHGTTVTLIWEKRRAIFEN